MDTFRVRIWITFKVVSNGRVEVWVSVVPTMVHVLFLNGIVIREIEVGWLTLDVVERHFATSYLGHILVGRRWAVTRTLGRIDDIYRSAGKVEVLVSSYLENVSTVINVRDSWLLGTVLRASTDSMSILLVVDNAIFHDKEGFHDDDEGVGIILGYDRIDVARSGRVMTVQTWIRRDVHIDVVLTIQAEIWWLLH